MPRKARITPRVMSAIQRKEPLIWKFDGQMYHLMSGDEEIALRLNDVSVLGLHNQLLTWEANIDPAAVTLSILAYYANYGENDYIDDSFEYWFR